MFHPQSIALLGASDKAGSIGRVVYENLNGAEFRGAVWPVNPKYEWVGGRVCFQCVGELPGTPDLAVIMTPPTTVPGLIADLGTRGTKAALVITAGLGHGERSLFQALLDAACPHTLRVIGPNSIGMIIPYAGLNASFAQAIPPSGSLAVISQSGAVITTLIDWANERRIGFSALVSVGDMADIDFGDLIDWFAADSRTKAILLYIEGITNSRKFVSSARAAARVKPVIVIKSGRHREAARAAASHTGALAGVDAIYDAVFRRTGILRVTDLEEFFDAATTLDRVSPFAGERLGVITNGGGVGVLAVDRLIDLGGVLAELNSKTIGQLDKHLPRAWSGSNPVDIIGDAGPDRYRVAMEAMIADEAVDAILIMNCPTALSSTDAVVETVKDVVTSYKSSRFPTKPIFAAWLGGGAADRARGELADLRVPHYVTPDAAIKGFMHLVRYSKAQAMLGRVPTASPHISFNVANARSTVGRALDAGRQWLSSTEIADVLAAYDVPFTAPRLASTPEKAAMEAAEMLTANGSVVIKIASPDIVHKSDVGGVRLDLRSAQEVGSAARDMLTSVSKAVPDARIEGVTVERMIHRSGARELILGIVDDPLFGPVILFGEGGTAVEVIRDRALALPPLDIALAHDLISQTRVARLLASYRQEPAADVEAVALTLVKLAQIAADLPEIREFEINPLVADAQGVVAVDARVRVESEPRRDRHGLNPRFSIRPYPTEWVREIILDGNWKILVRPIMPQDEQLCGAFFSKISKEDLRLRFFNTAIHFSHAVLARMTQIDYARAMIFVALDSSANNLLGIASLHADPNHERAEFAVLVRSDLKGRGLGWALMKLLVEYGRADDLKELRGDVLSENTTMLMMCKELGFSLERSREDLNLFTALLKL